MYIMFDVPLDGPKNTFVRPSPPGEIMEGGSVTLSCSSDANAAADYTWFKDNQPLLWEPRRPSSSEANPVAKYTWSKVPTDHPLGHSVQGQQLSFHPIQSSHSGQYLCKAENDLGTTTSSPISIDVKCE